MRKEIDSCHGEMERDRLEKVLEPVEGWVRAVGETGGDQEKHNGSGRREKRDQRGERKIPRIPSPVNVLVLIAGKQYGTDGVCPVRMRFARTAGCRWSVIIEPEVYSDGPRRKNLVIWRRGDPRPR